MEFGKHISIADFKANNNVTALNVVKNPKTGKLFVEGNNKTLAAVSTKWDSSKDSEFVELIDGETTVLCLVNSNSANVVATL